MSLWDNITQKAAAVTDKAVHQAKNFTEQVKLRNQISEAQSTITDCYTQIGKQYAAAHSEDFDEAYAPMMAAIAGATRLGPAFSEAAAALCDTKLADGWGSLFFLGVLCNLLIYIAVEGYKTCPYELGKYLSILFGVVVFILTGTEHSVADMYYFAMAGKLFAARSLGVLAVISLGNVCGGLILPLLRKAVAALEK